MIEINEKFKEALDILEKTNRNLFITGKAGTGKSTLLEHFRSITKKNVAILAPTGVAALNVKGQTIHSFFRIPPNITPDKVLEHQAPKKQRALIQKLDMIIIDEASMLRADLLDCIDTALRHYHENPSTPFGGVQMVFIGDLFQLPPVVAGQEEKALFSSVYQSPYFFSAHVFYDLDYTFLELEKIYRQSDQEFIDLLNKIRDNSIDYKHLEDLNLRHIPNYNEPENDFVITLNTTNAEADKKNSLELAKINTETQVFDGEIEGNFKRQNLPTKMELELKIGAQIMMLSNDMAGRWVNGSIGKVKDILFEEIEVELDNGRTVKVEQHSWNIHKYFFNEATGRIDTETVGSFTQYPMRLAWAVTIHKSQGKTFENVIIDIGRGTFAHGQIYVALSRCTSFEGIVLKKPIQRRHIWMDKRITNFFNALKPC